MFSKKNLFRVGGTLTLIVGTLLGIRILKSGDNDPEQTKKESLPTQLPTQIPKEISNNILDENSSGNINGKRYKENSVSTYEVVDDPFGSSRECLQVGINTPENPQTAFGVVRAVGDPETFDVQVDLLFEDGHGGYFKVKTFKAGEIPGPEWSIIQPRTRGCEGGY